jgi:hypothetical protein
LQNRKLVYILLAALVCSLAAAAPAVKKKAPAKSSQSSRKTSSKKATTTKKTAAKKSTKSSTRRTARRPARPSWRNTQRTPTPERYKEIQQALADRGYLDPGAPSGVWDAASVAALKKFQEAENLAASGKIDSLSLIALGLGPRRDQASSQPLPPPAQQP